MHIYSDVFFYRKEFKTIRAQYVNTGFASCGVSGAMGVRRTINSANLTVSYFPQENKFVMNHTQPQQNNVRINDNVSDFQRL